MQRRARGRRRSPATRRSRRSARARWPRGRGLLHPRVGDDPPDLDRELDSTRSPFFQIAIDRDVAQCDPAPRSTRCPLTEIAVGLLVDVVGVASTGRPAPARLRAQPGMRSLIDAVVIGCVADDRSSTCRPTASRSRPTVASVCSPTRERRLARDVEVHVDRAAGVLRVDVAGHRREEPHEIRRAALERRALPALVAAVAGARQPIDVEEAIARRATRR